MIAARTIDLRDAPIWRDEVPTGERILEIRRFDPLSVARVSALFYLCVLGVLLVTAIVLWFGVAVTGVLGNVERFLRDAGFENFRFLPGQLMAAFTVAGAVLVAAGTVANLLLAVLYNLIVDVVGGVRMSVAVGTASKAATANLSTPLPAATSTTRGYSSVG